jgi:hypothetical protein
MGVSRAHHYTRALMKCTPPAEIVTFYVRLSSPYRYYSCFHMDFDAPSCRKTWCNIFYATNIGTYNGSAVSVSVCLRGQRYAERIWNQPELLISLKLPRGRWPGCYILRTLLIPVLTFQELTEIFDYSDTDNDVHRCSLIMHYTDKVGMSDALCGDWNLLRDFGKCSR